PCALTGISNANGARRWRQTSATPATRSGRKPSSARWTGSTDPASDLAEGPGGDGRPVRFFVGRAAELLGGDHQLAGGAAFAIEVAGDRDAVGLGQVHDAQGDRRLAG